MHNRLLSLPAELFEHVCNFLGPFDHWVMSKAGTYNYKVKEPTAEEATIMAVWRRSVNLLRWLVEINKFQSSDSVLTALYSVGFLEGLQWFHNHDITVVRSIYDMPWRSSPVEDIKFHYCAAAINGHLPVLMWAIETFPDKIELSTLAYYASKGGHVGILDWIYKKTRGFDASVLMVAVQKNKLKVIRFLIDKIDPHRSYYDFAGTAAAHNHLEALKILISAGINRGNALQQAVKHQLKDITTWCIEQGYRYDDSLCRISLTDGLGGREFHVWFVEKGYCKCQGRFAPY